MSHSLLWRHIVLLTVGVYSSNQRVLYTIAISMTRRFQKSVGPSVRLQTDGGSLFVGHRCNSYLKLHIVFYHINSFKEEFTLAVMK